MADRHEDRGHFAIVPDPEASLSSPRRRGPPPPKVWPLWLLLLGVTAAGGGTGYLAWEERVRFEAELARLSGELSNVHARFDTALGEGDTLTDIEERLSDLERRDEEGEDRLAGFEEALAEGLEAQESHQESLERLADAATTRETMLIATQTSLDALERAGSEGRAALGEALESQRRRLDELFEARDEERRHREAIDERLEVLATEIDQAEGLERLEADHQALAERLAEAEQTVERGRETLEERLVALSEEVEALAEARDDERGSKEAMAGRLSALEMEIGELRRDQLALSARLEALTP